MIFKLLTKNKTVKLDEQKAKWLADFLKNSGGVTITVTKDGIEFDDQLIELLPGKNARAK